MSVIDSLYTVCPVCFAAIRASLREIPIKSQMYFLDLTTCAGESHPHHTL